MQLTLSNGNEQRRWIFWPRFGQIGVRLWGCRWLSLYWQARPWWIDRVFPGWMRVRGDRMRRFR